MKRVLTALVAIPALIYVIMLAPQWVCVSIIVIGMLLALHEYFALAGVNPLFRATGSLIAGAGCVISIWPQAVIVVLTGSMLVLIVALFSRLELAEAVRSAAFTLLGSAYVGGLMGFLIALRVFSQHNLNGSDLLMMLFVVIWSGDSFAYFAGKSIGKHKLAPVVSPHKTWEGAVAGFLFSIVAAIACKYGFVQEMNLMDAVGVGAIVGVIGQVGDLCESVVKRAAKVKDSGGIIPGHGGMLDRLDSLLFGAPAMYYYLSFFG